MVPKFEPGDWLQAPFWPSAVQVMGIQSHADYDAVRVHSDDQHRSRTCLMIPADWEQVRRVTQADHSSLYFEGDSVRFRPGIEAYRRLAHSIYPYAALNASRIDPLPNQFEAVYEHLLAQRSTLICETESLETFNQTKQ